MSRSLVFIEWKPRLLGTDPGLFFLSERRRPNRNPPKLAWFPTTVVDFAKASTHAFSVGVDTRGGFPLALLTDRQRGTLVEGGACYFLSLVDVRGIEPRSARSLNSSSFTCVVPDPPGRGPFYPQAGFC